MRVTPILLVCGLAMLITAPVYAADQTASNAPQTENTQAKPHKDGKAGRHKVIFVAHRGESYLAPENTLASYNLAWKNGDKGVELDIYLTPDKKVVCIHDGTTGRTTGGQANLTVKDTNSEELRKLDFGKWKAEQYAGEKIPFLSEVLDTIPKGGNLVIEIKVGPEILPYFADVLNKSGKRKQVTVISFNMDSAAQFKKLMPDVPTLWLASAGKNKQTGQIEPYDQRHIKAALDNHLDGLDLEYSQVTKEFVDVAKAAGLTVWVWTVDDPVKAKELIRMGVDGVTTNRCHWLEEQCK